MHSPRGNSEDSHVFLLRVWRDGGWRGRVQDLLSGEAYGFTGWPELLAALSAALPPEERQGEGDDLRKP